MFDNNDDDPGPGSYILGLCILILLVLCILWFFGGLNMVVGREFAKYGEETRRQVFETSRTYQEGMAQNIDNLCLEYDRTGNVAILSSIRQRTAGYNGEFPDHLKDCVAKARKGN